MSIHSLALTGGVFAVLVFWHFLSDWVFQSHKEALAKAKDWRVRLRHVTVYSTLFLPLFWLVGFWGAKAAFAWLLLMFSHFVIDTYIPVMLWAKYLRRAPQFKDVVPPVTFTKEQMEQMMAGTLPMIVNPPRKGWSDHEVDRITYKSDGEAFYAFFMTPVGAILCITMDQFLHIGFLLPIAWLMVH